jgi:multiple sugar transport system permease protein
VGDAALERLVSAPASLQAPADDAVAEDAIVAQSRRARRALARAERVSERSIISPQDRKSPRVRRVLLVVSILVTVGLVVISIGPLAWLLKAATSTTTETLRDPFSLWPSGIHWSSFAEAFRRVRFGTYLANTLWICLGNWAVSMVVATTGAYFLAILRPRYAKVISGLLLATLFIPGIVSLVPLYLTIIHVPLIGVNLLNTFWAVWLPAGASAFNVLLVQRAFAALPQDVFEAARIDGAGRFRVFWSIVLPMSRPILGVVSLLTLVAAYKDFLWPLLVLPASGKQPLSVALPRLAQTTELSVYLAALFLALVIPVGLFVIFQRQFLSAASSQGAIKE